MTLQGCEWLTGTPSDNPFSVAKSRAEKAGTVLADALVNRAQGERPVNLIGYSLGARVIYACLLSLVARKAFGLIDSVVLIGAPIPSDGADWRAMRSVVSARLVNVYSENDYVLGFLYRTSSIQLGVAGLQRVEGVMGVENVDVSDTVSGHLRYRYLLGAILRKIGFEDLDLHEIEREAEAFKHMEEEEKERMEELKKKIPKQIPSTASTVKGMLPKSWSKKDAKGEGDVSSKAKASADALDANAEAQERPADERAVQTAAEKEAESLQKDVEEKTRKTLVQTGLEWVSWWRMRQATGDAGKTVSNAAGSAQGATGSKPNDPTSSGSYISYAKSAWPFGGKDDSSNTGSASEAAAAVEAETPKAVKDGTDKASPSDVRKSWWAGRQKSWTGKPEAPDAEKAGKEGDVTGKGEKDEGMKQRSYLEMAAESGAGVGATASSWYKGARGWVGGGGKGDEVKEEGKKERKRIT